MELKELLDKCINDRLIDLTISGQKVKDEEGVMRVKIRPVQLKDGIKYQASEFVGRKVLHTNYSEEEIKTRITEYMENTFKQAQFNMTDATATVLSSKKGACTCKYKKLTQIKSQNDMSHNRTKTYILKEGEKVDFLVDLGVMTKEGAIVRTRYDKFRQINRFLEFIEDILPQLDKDKEQTIIDFGCGKSYLTFAMYYYLHELKGYDIRIIGLDLKTDVILHCNELAKKYGYEKLTFLVGDIADYEGVDQVDMVVTLHACDTATDYALAKAVGWNAKVILSVPCCQHEVNKQLEKQRNLHLGKMKSKTEVMEVSEMLGDQLASMEEVLGPIMDYGLLRERFSALVTDGLRAKRLESEGYETQVLEFIDMEHTPKNILLRAVKKGSPAAKSRKEAEDCERFLKIQPTLGMLLAEQKGDK